MDLQLPMQSVPITTDVVSSNLHQGKVYNICNKVCQWLVTGQWFSTGLPVSSTNKTDRHDITEIVLKVALNTIKQTNFKICKIYLLKVEHTFPTRLDYMSNMASVL